jgi:polyisoprenoid-binding protein YceI
MKIVLRAVKTARFWSRKRRFVAILIAFLAISMALQAQQTQTVAIHFDPDATTIHWTLNSLLHTARGTFKLKGGEVVVNPKTGLAQGEVLIDAASASGSGGDASRVATWQKGILESATYPAIIFHPSKVEGLKAVDGPQQLKATGTITLHGQDHPIELTLAAEVKGKDVTMTTHFIVPYVAWGLKQAGSGLGRYDKQVVIDLTAKGHITQGTATPSAPQ